MIGALHVEEAATKRIAKGIQYHNPKDIQADELPKAWVRRIMKGVKK